LNQAAQNPDVGDKNYPHEKPNSIWFFASGILSCVGFGLSLYSLIHHLKVRSWGFTDAACNINATVNCDAVALSPYAEPFFGLPLGVFGMGFFLGLLVLLAFGKSSARSSPDHLQAYGIFSIIGIVTSAVLGALSWFSLGLVCLVCIGVYIICIALGIGTFLVRKQVFSNFDFKKMINGSWSGALAVMVIVIGFQTYKTQFAAPPNLSSSKGSKELPTLAKDRQEIPLSTSAYSGLGEDYRKGSDEASVVIHEFADFQCPACQQASKTLGDLYKEFGNKILVVFRNYPLDGSCNSGITSQMHPYACQAALLTRCAGQYGKFWQAHDMVFEKQFEISDESLSQWATESLGLTPDQWTTCKNSPDILNKIREDVALGNKLGVDSTPSIFINGKKVLGRRDYDSLRILIEQELSQK
jgi:protein-disulfide isomerase/uncharacterized membrane protein